MFPTVQKLIYFLSRFKKHRNIKHCYRDKYEKILVFFSTKETDYLPKNTYYEKMRLLYI